MNESENWVYKTENQLWKEFSDFLGIYTFYANENIMRRKARFN